MSESGQNWLKVLFGGIGVAAFSFAAPIVWQQLSHKSLGPQYVNASLQVEHGVLYLMVRNGSDDPLDLKEADFEVEAGHSMPSELGAYVEPSHVYKVDSASPTELVQHNGRLLVRLRIAQAIKAGQVDRFGFKILGPNGALVPTAQGLTAKLVDLKGNVYPIKY